MGFFAEWRALHKALKANLADGEPNTALLRAMSEMYGGEPTANPQQPEKPPVIRGLVSSAPVKETLSVDGRRAVEVLEQHKAKPAPRPKRHYGRTFLISALFGAIWQGTRRR